MIILSQNCRGLGRAKARRSLKGLIKSLSPDVLFLSEVKTSKDSIIRRLLNAMGFLDVHIVPPVGKAGGLILSWKPNINITILESNRYFINGRVTPDPPVPPWNFTGVYGPPGALHKPFFWEKIDKLAADFDGASLFIGDFNSILSQAEKRGGNPFTSSSRGGLQEVIDKNGLIDLGFEGPAFTWSNRQGGGKNIKERLDRGLVNTPWNILFPQAFVTHLAAETSDHAPILLRTSAAKTFRPRPFRFEVMWARDNTCVDVIQGAWRNKRGSNPTSTLYSALGQVRQDLKIWNKKYFGHCKNLVDMFREKIKEIQGMPHCDRLMEIEHQLQEELDENLLRLELMWRQKSRSEWLEAGDENTKYFHLNTIINRRTNQIKCIKGDSNEWITDQEAIGRYFTQYFKIVFTSSDPEYPPNLQHIMKAAISSDENKMLCMKPEEVEIRSTLWEMGSQKSPGPDGMPPFFYKHYWNIVKEEIISFVHHFFECISLGEGGNHTFITLIKKQDKPSKPSHFRPISLCNVSYKIVSKILATRLKKVLDGIISVNQSAFVPGRNITDNSIVSQELMHFLHKHKGKNGYMAIKIDMEKAYDRVEWGFLAHMMELLGFDDKFIQMIKQCISSATFSILINGSPEGHFESSQGLRQGDPLSPYLFLLYFELLSRMLQLAEEEGHIKGIKVCRTAPAFNHLMYADDLVIFCRASLEDAAVIEHILDLFGTWSGSKVNKDKSSIHFGQNVSLNTKQNVCHLLGLRECNHRERHLGLPFCKGKSKRTEFEFVLNKIKSKLSGWRGKVLSQASRSVLINSVLSSIPSYCMQSFNLPVSICEHIDRMARKFFWGAKEDKQNYMALVAWDNIALPKQAGGLGFRKMIDQNKAFTTKLTWQMFDPGKKVWSRIFKAKYLKHKRITEASGTHKGSSWGWQAICSNIDLIKEYTCFTVGANSIIHIWDEAWVPGCPGAKVPLHLKKPDSPLLVKELFLPSGEWNSELIKKLFPIEISNEILKIVISSSVEPLAPIWLPSKTGKFTVKSAYISVIDRSLNNRASVNRQIWKNLWATNLHGRHKHLLWRFLQKAIPVGERMNKIFPNSISTCYLCNNSVESMDHLFLHCHVMKGLLFNSKWNFRIQNSNTTLAEWIEKLIDPMNDLFHSDLNRKEFLNFFMVSSDQIWRVRNQILFNNEEMVIEELQQQVFKISEDYWRSQKTKSLKCNTKGAEIVWMKPGKGVIKFNSDAAVSNGYSCVVWVARNDKGNIVGASAECYPTITVEEAEGKAMLGAMEHALKLGIKNSIFEGDSFNVVSAILDENKECEWQARHIIQKARSVCNLMIHPKIRYIPRICNEAAHNLAQWAKNKNWIGGVPLNVIPSSVFCDNVNSCSEFVTEFENFYN